MWVKFKSVDQTTIIIENVDRAYDQRSDSVRPPGVDAMSGSIKRVAVFDDLSPYANDIDRLEINRKFYVETFYLNGYRYFKACLNTLHEESGWAIRIKPNDLNGSDSLEVRVPDDEVTITL